jgi:hypothetical protein
MGTSEAQDDLFRSVRELCDGALGSGASTDRRSRGPGTATRRRPAASMATRDTSRWMPSRRSSRRRRLRRATRPQPRRSSPNLLTRADDAAPSGANHPSEKAAVYGDASYGTADFVEKLESAGIDPMVKVQPPSARAGMFSQDDFTIDTKSAEVSCPAGVRVSLRVLKDGSRVAEFGDHCADCPMRQVHAVEDRPLYQAAPQAREA